jgi:hypothetical protein
MNGNVYMVIRPEDGATVPLTCTKEQLKEFWLPKGYKLAGKTENAEEVTADEPTEPEPDHKTKSRR